MLKLASYRAYIASYPDIVNAAVYLNKYIGEWNITVCRSSVKKMWVNDKHNEDNKEPTHDI